MVGRRIRHGLSVWASGLLLACPLTAVAQAPKAETRMDREGFPLPREAIARIGSARLRADGEILRLAYTPDGRTIITVASAMGSPAWGGSLQFWDAATGQLRRRFAVPNGLTAKMALAADGKFLRLVSRGVLHEYDVATGKELRTVAFAKDALSFEEWIAPQGNRAALQLQNGDVLLYELTHGKEIACIKAKTLPGRESAGNAPMALSTDGRLLAISPSARVVAVFETATGKLGTVLDVPLQEPIEYLHFSPDAHDLLCIARSEAPILVRDWAGKPKHVQLGGKPNANPTFAAFAPDGRHIAIGDSWPFVKLFDAATGKEVRRFACGGMLSRTAFSADGRRLLIGNRTGAISQWDVATGKPVAIAADPLARLEVVRFTPDGKHLLIATDRHELVDWRTGRLVHRYPPPALYYASSASLSADGTLLAAPKYGALSLRNAKTGKELGCIGSKEDPVHWHVMAPAGDRLFTTGGLSVDIWRLPKLERIHRLKLAVESTILAVSHDGKRLATAANHAITPVEVWDTATGARTASIVPRLGSAYGLAFAPDGDTLGIETGDPQRLDGNEISLVNLRTGREWRGSAPLTQQATCLRFSPDGRTLAIGVYGQAALCLWEVATGKERHRFIGHTNAVYGLAYSDDGGFLAASSSEAPAYVWDVYGRAAPQAPAPPWSAAQAQQLWRDLIDADAAVAFQAIRRLVGSPKAGVKLLRQVVKPAQQADPKQVRQLLHELDGDDFPTRQAAYVELEKLGDRAFVELAAAQRRPPSLETKRRVATLLARLDTPTPEHVRWLRAAESLEAIGTVEATDLLRDWARGAAGSRLTIAAAAAVARLDRR